MGNGGIAPTFLTSALDGDKWSATRPRCITPGERARGTHWIGGWVGPRAGLDAVGMRKYSFPCQESNPRPFNTSAVTVPTELSLG
jgi:hypothetical protein